MNNILIVIDYLLAEKTISGQTKKKGEKEINKIFLFIFYE